MVQKEYDPIFSEEDISLLKAVGCTPLVANTFKGISVDLIVGLSQRGILPRGQPWFDEREKLSDGRTVDLLSALINRKSALLGYSAASIVVQIWKDKASKHIMRMRCDREEIPAVCSSCRMGDNKRKCPSEPLEIISLYKLKCLSDWPANIIKLHNSMFYAFTDSCFHEGKKQYFFQCNDIINFEKITGNTLEQVAERGKPNLQKILNYSRGILNGLYDLRRAGIWHHRDIRPANIMIDEEKDRAVIIDLGIATTDKDALAEDNRRFGSPSGRRANDLTSLGQVVYKMAAGEHIFAESKSMERTTFADQLRDHRDWIYERPEERLPPYLRRVEETVKDRDLCGIVNSCLASEGTDKEYQHLSGMFEGFYG